TSPGQVTTVIYRAIRDDGKYWNWQSSTFTAVNAPATDLTATLGANWTYTTTYFQNNAAWENGRSYTIHEDMTDKAGNITDLAHAAFTFDTVVPTATITLPIVAASTTGVTSLPTISGTANDDNANGTVQLAVEDIAATLWLDANTTGFTFGPTS